LVINDIALSDDNHLSWDLFSSFQHNGIHISICVTFELKSVHILFVLLNDFDSVLLVPTLNHTIDLFAEAPLDRGLTIAYQSYARLSFESGGQARSYLVVCKSIAHDNDVLAG